METWRGLEDVQRSGLAKSIGVSNFNLNQLKRLIKEASIKPVAIQVEVNKSCYTAFIAIVIYMKLIRLPNKCSDKSIPILKHLCKKCEIIHITFSGPPTNYTN